MEYDMSFTHTHASPITDRTNESRSTSIYDTARSYLDPLSQVHLQDHPDAKGCVREPRQTSFSPSVVDYRFFQAPGVALNRFLNGDTEDSVPECSRRGATAPTDPFANYARYWKTRYGKENQLGTSTLSESTEDDRNITLRPRRALTLETIAERGSHSTVTSQQSLSGVQYPDAPSSALLSPYGNGTRSRSAPCILVTTTNTSATYSPSLQDCIRRECNLWDKDSAAGEDHRVRFPALQFWASLCSSAIRRDPSSNEHALSSSGTWPILTASKRTPAPSLRTIFDKLLASGFTSDTSLTPDISNRESRSGQGTENYGRKSLIFDQFDSESHSEASREFVSIKSVGGEVSQENHISESLCQPREDSLAMMSLQRVLLASEPEPTAGTVESHYEWKHISSEKDVVQARRPSLARTKSTVSSIRDIAESLRAMTLSTESSSEENVGVTLAKGEKTFAEFSGSSYYSSSSGSLEKPYEVHCGIPPQTSMDQVEGSMVTIPFTGANANLLIAKDQRTTSSSPHNSLTPSPLRPRRPKQLPNLSLFPAPPTTISPVAITNPSRWRSLSSLLRFSHRDPINKEFVHHYNCRHGHRIVSTSTYSGDKLKRSRIHTEAFRMNAPDSCWRCSAKDVCDKVWQKISLKRLRQRRKHMHAAPLFIDPSISTDAQSDTSPHGTKRFRRLSKPNVKDSRANSDERCPHGRSLQSTPALISKAIPSPDLPKSGIHKIAIRCRKCTLDTIRKESLLKWVTKNVVLCGVTDESMEAIPCRVKALRVSSARRLID